VCVIIDNNVVGQLFGSGREHTKAEEKFYEYINNGKPKLVAGGRLKDELFRHNKFRKWFIEADRRGDVKIISRSKIKFEENNLSNKCYRSNDLHVLAIALVSGARLLCTNDKKLIDDFKDNNLINKPSGKIIKPPMSEQLTDIQKTLLDNAYCGT